MNTATIADYRHNPEVRECECESHPEGAVFWVTVRDGARYAAISGPYKTHPEALAMVPTVRAWGENADPRAVFYAWGTSALAADYAPRTITEPDGTKRIVGTYEYMLEVDAEASRRIRSR